MKIKVIEIKLVIPYKEEFCLPAFTGLIEGYTEIRILKAEQKETELELERVQQN